jgi:hypothetical protein
MEIELNMGRIPPATPPAATEVARPAAPASDEVRFSGTAALAEALAQLPDTRPEVVQRTKEILGTVPYPPDETLSRLATLLAMKMDGSGSE